MELEKSQDTDTTQTDETTNQEGVEKKGKGKKFEKEVTENMKAVFKANPTVRELIVCSDGAIFLLKSKSDAINHCNRDGATKSKEPLEWVKVLRSEV